MASPQPGGGNPRMPNQPVGPGRPIKGPQPVRPGRPIGKRPPKRPRIGIPTPPGRGREIRPLPIDEKIVRTMPITQKQLGQIKKMYGI